eukprot:scaffold6923_cov81-Cylindrotheca_fusiformis.AAC.2
MIADSGSADHVVNTRKGMYDCVKVENEKITVGNGTTLKVEMIGKMRGQLENSDSRRSIPKMKVNWPTTC